jgi:RNA polymerase sigma-70 factor (ECF subfamily)
MSKDLCALILPNATAAINRIAGKNHPWREDLIQGAALKCFENIHKYNCEKGNFSSWVSTVTKFYFIDEMRRQSKLPGISEEIDVSNLHVVDISVDNRLKELNIKNLLNTLSTKQRKVVILKIKFNCSGREISAITGIPEHHVSAYFSKAKAALREKLAA